MRQLNPGTRLSRFAMHYDTIEGFSGWTIGLHWFIATGMIGLIVLGVTMHEMDVSPFKFQLYAIHKSVGLLIFPFAVYRIYWRLRNGFPRPVGNTSSIEHVLAKIVHYTLIVGTVVMPISGAMYSGAGGFGVAFFGLELVPANFVDGKAVAFNAAVSGVGQVVHGVGGNLLILAIGLHAIGALKHHVVDRDGTLRRMLGTT